MRREKLMDAEDQQHLEELRHEYGRRVRELEKQAAKFGARSDPAILTEIQDLKKEIILIEKRLGIQAKNPEIDKPGLIALSVQDSPGNKSLSPSTGRKALLLVVLASVAFVAVVIITSFIAKNNEASSLLPTITTLQTRVALPTLLPVTQIITVTEIVTPSPDIVLSKNNISERDISQTAPVSTRNDDGTIGITGAWFQRVWINRKVPDNFRATFIFKTISANSVNFGLGNGQDMYPSIIFWLGSKESVLANALDDKNWIRPLRSLDEVDTIKPNTRYVMTIERENGTIRAVLNGSPLMESFTNPQITNRGNYLFMSANKEISNKTDSGEILIEDIIIENINS